MSTAPLYGSNGRRVHVSNRTGPPGSNEPRSSNTRSSVVCGVRGRPSDRDRGRATARSRPRGRRSPPISAAFARAERGSTLPPDDLGDTPEDADVDEHGEREDPPHLMVAESGDGHRLDAHADHGDSEAQQRQRRPRLAPALGGRPQERDQGDQHGHEQPSPSNAAAAAPGSPRRRAVARPRSA
jgi:hypothetical protein